MSRSLFGDGGSDDDNYEDNSNDSQKLQNNMVIKLNDKTFFTIKRMNNIYVVFKSDEKLLPQQKNNISYLRESNLSPNQKFIELKVQDFKHVYEYNTNKNCSIYSIKNQLIRKTDNNDDLLGKNDTTIHELFKSIKGLELVLENLEKLN